jgi:hypothetical protein
MSDNDRVIARLTRQSLIAYCDIRIAPYELIQFGNNRVTINSIRFVYGGLPIGESALRVTGCLYMTHVFLERTPKPLRFFYFCVLLIMFSDY